MNRNETSFYVKMVVMIGRAYKEFRKILEEGEAF